MNSHHCHPLARLQLQRLSSRCRKPWRIPLHRRYGPLFLPPRSQRNTGQIFPWRTRVRSIIQEFSGEPENKTQQDSFRQSHSALPGFNHLLSIDRLIDWLDEALVHWLIDWLDGALVHWLIDWLACAGLLRLMVSHSKTAWNSLWLAECVTLPLRSCSGTRSSMERSTTSKAVSVPVGFQLLVVTKMADSLPA